MNPRRDDDALNWAGDDDPTLHEGSADRARPAPDGLSEGWTTPQVSANHPVATDSTTDADTPAPETAQPSSPAASSTALVGMGILAGMYLLYSIGWFIGVARVSTPSMAVSPGDPVVGFMTSLGGWLAVAAPMVWFGSTFWLTMSRPRARWVFLLLGVVVLIPFPFLVGSGQPL